jgi:D-alanine--poly(phosphoribitol) ligase subunit 1
MRENAVTSVVAGASAPRTTIHDAVFRMVAARPDAVAVRDDRHSISYAQLRADALRTAQGLAARGVRPGEVVAVAARRTAELPSLLLGVLLAGAAYGIVDVRWPPSRIASLVTAMRPAAVVGDAAGSDSLTTASVPHLAPGELSRVAARTANGAALPRVGPDAAATVFWTSGSTGSPKAVLSPHRATTRLVAAGGCVPLGSTPVTIAAAAVPWDAFTFELWATLLSGGTVVMHEDDLLFPGLIREYVRHGATHLFLTAALFDVIGEDVTCLDGLRVVTVGGDRLRPESCRALLGSCPSVALYNGYGPVESCVFAATHRVTPEDVDAEGGIPLGRPVAGTSVAVRRGSETVPRGERGEIVLAGDGLALGYLNAPERTAEVFRDADLDGRRRRVYLTGDRGWIDDAGLLHFDGRLDDQFKVAGHRIEPAEIETAARTVGCVQPVVVPIAGRDGSPRIVLFSTPPSPHRTETDVRAALSEVLPGYMVPASVHFVDTIPLLGNAKVDRKRLAEQCGFRSGEGMAR